MDVYRYVTGLDTDTDILDFSGSDDLVELSSAFPNVQILSAYNRSGQKDGFQVLKRLLVAEIDYRIHTVGESAVHGSHGVVNGRENIVDRLPWPDLKEICIKGSLATDAWPDIHGLIGALEVRAEAGMGLERLDLRDLKHPELGQRIAKLEEWGEKIRPQVKFLW